MTPRKAIKYRILKDGRYMVSYCEEPGRWHSSPEVTKERAMRWALKNRARLLGKAKSLKFREFAEGFFSPDSPWIARMRAKGHVFGAAYMLNRAGHVANYLVPLFGEDDPRDLTRRYVDDKLLAMTAKNGRPLAGATKSKILYSLNLILEDIVDRGVLESNPIEGITPYSKAPVAPRGAIPREAMEKLYPASHGELVRIWGSSMWAALFCYLHDTGCRPGEARALRWMDWDESRKFVAIRHGIQAGTQGTIKGTKTGIVRPAFCSERTKQELAIWRAESRHNKEEDFVFTAMNTGAPVSATAIIKAFRRGLEQVGITGERWTPYWLRHSFGTYNLAILSQQELMLLMGHTSIVTSAVYQHPDDEVVFQRAGEIQEKLDRAR